MVHDPEIAAQYLLWALEEIDHPRAAHHVRLALRELGAFRPDQPIRFVHEAKRFRDKADEAEQLAELAVTEARRSALKNVAESYRRTAQQLERISDVTKRDVK